MIRKIIFDCFGTLIDTGSTSLNAAKTILKNVGSDINAEYFYPEWKRTKKEMMMQDTFYSEKELFGLSLKIMFDKYGIKADAEIEVRPMIDILFGDRRVFPDTVSTLETLEKQGIECAVGSTTDTDSLMHFLDLNALEFRYIFTSEDMKVYKPFPAFYSTILKETGWDVCECLFVGDSLVDDVKGPQNIGMKAALLDRNHKYSDSSDIKPDYIIHSLSELTEIVKKY